MTPAVRTPTGPCIEEEDCNWELATVCAFNNTDTGGSVAFLACMDESTEDTALVAAKPCAAKTGIDFSKISSCFSGAQGLALLTVASAAFNKQFPAAAFVPHVFAGAGEFVGGNATYAGIKKALCDAGSTAAVCKGQFMASQACMA